MKLKNLPYNYNFYWKGNRYVQFIRPKINPKGAFTVTCYLSCDPCDGYIDMPAGREVKPVCSIEQAQKSRWKGENHRPDCSSSGEEL